MPRKQQNPTPAAVTKRTQRKPSPAAQLREYEATMADHRSDYLAYERAHAALRAGRLAPSKAKKVKAEHREAHRLYWHAYERARLLKKAAEAQRA